MWFEGILFVAHLPEHQEQLHILHLHVSMVFAKIYLSPPKGSVDNKVKGNLAYTTTSDVS